jgi:Salmonella virulence plasmid 65kDa B protein
MSADKPDFLNLNGREIARLAEAVVAPADAALGCGPQLALAYDSGAGNGPFGFG